MAAAGDLHAGLTPSGRGWLSVLDLLSIAIALLAFAALIALIEGLDRVS